MPTAARLFAAIAMAILAMIVSEQFKPLMPEGTDFGYFTYVNAALGAIVGWRVIGKRAGQGIVQAINNGITGVLAFFLLTLFVHSVWRMLEHSTKLRYHGTVEALQSVFTQMLEFGLLSMTPTIITSLVIGAIGSGLLAEACWRRWR